MVVDEGSEADGASTAGARTPLTSNPAAEVVSLAARLLRLQSRLGADLHGAPFLTAPHDSARQAAMRSGVEVLRGFAVSLVAEIQTSIERDAFYYLYQPIASLATGAIEGYDALLRWQRGQEAVAAPLFLPIAEETGLLPRIQQHLLGDVARVLARLGPAVTIGIDWSVAQLADAGAVTAMIEWAHQRGLDAARVIIGVSDRTGAPCPESLQASLARLRTVGFQLALEGFGSSQDGLGCLSRLPVDLIRIDGSLVRALEHSVRGALIVGSLIDVAHRLGHRVVALGVNTARQLSMLAELGCDLAQGDAVGEPTRDPVAPPARPTGAA